MRAMQIAAAAVLTVALSASLNAQASVAITGATIYPVSGPKISNATIVFTNGVITAVGSNVAIPADARRIDGTGKWITPGLIATATSLGVVEVGAVGDTRDGRARGKDNIAASFRVWEGFNPRSVSLPVARQDGGITTVGVMPSGGMVSGLGAAYDLMEGASAASMVRKAPVAMVATLDNAAAAGAGSRAEALARLRTLLSDAREFNLARLRYDAGNMRELSAGRADLDAMQLVLKRTIPLVISADRASEILNAITIGREFGVRVVINGGAEAWSVASELALAKVPVLTGAMNNIPESFGALGNARRILRCCALRALRWRSWGMALEAKTVSMCAICATRRATPSRSACRGMTRCVPSHWPRPRFSGSATGLARWRSARLPTSSSGAVTRSSTHPKRSTCSLREPTRRS